MMKTSFCVFTVVSLVFSMTSLSAAFDPNPELLQFCTVVSNLYAKNTQASSSYSTSTDVDYGVDFPVDGVPVNLDFGLKDSLSSRKTSLSNLKKQYNSRNCDAVLEASSRVSIAQINANRDLALQRMKLQQHFYEQDTKKAIALMQAGVEHHRIDATRDSENRKTDAWKEVNIHRNNTDFNRTAIESSSNIVNTQVQGASNYLIVDRQAQTEEVRDAISNDQRHIQEEKKQLTNSIKNKQEY